MKDANEIICEALTEKLSEIVNRQIHENDEFLPVDRAGAGQKPTRWRF